MSEITARRCTACGALQSYPRPLCHVCKGQAFSALALPLQGEVYSLTTQARGPDPSWTVEGPFTVALVRGPQGGLLMLTLRGFGGALPAIGDPVRIDRDSSGREAGLAAYPV